MRETKVDAEATAWALLFPFRDPRSTLSTCKGPASSDIVLIYLQAAFCRRKKKKKKGKQFKFVKGHITKQIREWKPQHTQQGALVVLTGTSQEPRMERIQEQRGQQSLTRPLGHFLLKDQQPRTQGTQGTLKGVQGHREPAGPPGTQVNHRASWDTGKIRGSHGQQAVTEVGPPEWENSLSNTDTCLMVIFGNSKLKFNIVNAQI